MCCPVSKVRAAECWVSRLVHCPTGGPGFKSGRVLACARVGAHLSWTRRCTVGFGNKISKVNKKKHGQFGLTGDGRLFQTTFRIIYCNMQYLIWLGLIRTIGEENWLFPYFSRALYRHLMQNHHLCPNKCPNFHRKASSVQVMCHYLHRPSALARSAVIARSKQYPAAWGHLMYVPCG